MSVTRPLDLLEGDPVADLDRLGDRELDPGDHVADRVLGGEADDRRQHRGRGEDAGRQPLQLGELGERDATRMRKTTRISRRRRKRSRVLVDRETCETAGVMDATVSAKPGAFPVCELGPGSSPCSGCCWRWVPGSCSRFQW